MMALIPRPGIGKRVTTGSRLWIPIYIQLVCICGNSITTLDFTTKISQVQTGPGGELKDPRTPRKKSSGDLHSFITGVSIQPGAWGPVSVDEENSRLESFTPPSLEFLFSLESGLLAGLGR